jgi:hypothetical protein
MNKMEYLLFQHEIKVLAKYGKLRAAHLPGESWLRSKMEDLKESVKRLVTQSFLPSG